MSKSAKTAQEARVRKKPAYRSFRLSNRIKHDGPTLPGSFRLFRRAVKILHEHRTLFGGILLIYAALSVVLVRGFGSTTDLTDLNDVLTGIGQGAYSRVGTAVGLFSSLLSSSGNNTSDVAAAYQLFLALIISMVLIWALRQVLAKKKIRVRDCFYKGVYPTVLFILVLSVIGLQLIPMVIGNSLFNLVIANDIAVTAIEKVLWFMILGLLSLLSIYMVSSSIFALYIVTIPDMTPMKALRSARALVLHRRWAVLFRVVMLPIFLISLAALVIIPLIVFAPALAEWAFFLVSIVDLAILHSYMYSLYRELLG